MNQPNRAEEPSMDEILASIRKIISDDGPKQPGTNADGLAVVSREQPVPVEHPASLSAKLNGAFGYVPGSDPARMAAPATWTRTPAKAAIDDEMADLLADTPAPRPTSSQAPAPTLSAFDGLRPLDRVPTPASSPVAPVEQAKVVAVTATVAPAPVVIAAAPRLRPSVEPTLPPAPQAPAPSAAAAPVGAIVRASATEIPATEAPAPVVLAAMPAVAKAPDAGPAPEAPASVAPTATAAVDAISAAAVANALGSLAAGLAASSRPASPEIVVSADEVQPAQAAALESSPSPTSTSLTTEPSSPPPRTSVFTAPEAFIGGVALTPVKTFDDTAAELLRPMLRQWLDSNMPRIVEKALRIELTQSPELLPKPEDKA